MGCGEFFCWRKWSLAAIASLGARRGAKLERGPQLRSTAHTSRSCRRSGPARLQQHKHNGNSGLYWFVLVKGSSWLWSLLQQQGVGGEPRCAAAAGPKPRRPSGAGEGWGCSQNAFGLLALQRFPWAGGKGRPSLLHRHLSRHHPKAKPNLPHPAAPKPPPNSPRSLPRPLQPAAASGASCLPPLPSQTRLVLTSPDQLQNKFLML